jgi:hypothetical protein
MYSSCVIRVLISVLIGQFAFAATSPYTPLWLYNGSWRVTRKDLAPGAKPDELTNQCALVGKYFACQQAVNGTPGALLIFIPRAEAGYYYTQNIRPDGFASRRGDLRIEGNVWTYSSAWDQGGTTTYYKTVNTFTGRNRIHFEQLESKNNKDWKATNSGDEVRIAGPVKTAGNR